MAGYATKVSLKELAAFLWHCVESSFSLTLISMRAKAEHAANPEMTLFLV